MLRCLLLTQAQAAAQQEEAASAHEMEMQALHQKDREALAAAEEKHQEELTQQRAGLEEQHEAGMQIGWPQPAEAPTAAASPGGQAGLAGTLTCISNNSTNNNNFNCNSGYKTLSSS